MNLDMDYIKAEAAKPCYWLNDGVFNLPEWTQAMMQIAADRAGSKINSMKRDLDSCRPYLKEGETAADALKRLSAAAKWQPIRTAPRDGSVFAGWVGAERWREMDGECSGSVHDVSQLDLCWWREDGSLAGGFFDNSTGQIGDAQGVTHWMPLPAAPTTTED